MAVGYFIHTADLLQTFGIQVTFPTEKKNFS